MKGKRMFVIVLALGLALGMALIASLGMAQGPAPRDVAAPQEMVGTAFTYQGKLNDGGSPANGSYDFEFGLYDVASGGTALDTVHRSDVTLADGLFTVQLDFSGDAFTGDARWLEIRLRAGDAGPYTTLVPRQPLTAAPYALSLRPGATIHDTASGSFNAALRLSSDDGYGLTVGAAGQDGLFVFGAADNGVTVYDVGEDGVYVDSAGLSGLRVGSAGGDGVAVATANWSGLYVDSAGGDGVNVNQAGDDGVYVYQAGNPSNAFPQTARTDEIVHVFRPCRPLVGAKRR